MDDDAHTRFPTSSPSLEAQHRTQEEQEEKLERLAIEQIEFEQVDLGAFESTFAAPAAPHVHAVAEVVPAHAHSEPVFLDAAGEDDWDWGMDLETAVLDPPPAANSAHSLAPPRIGRRTPTSAELAALAVPLSGLRAKRLYGLFAAAAIVEDAGDAAAVAQVDAARAAGATPARRRSRRSLGAMASTPVAASSSSSSSLSFPVSPAIPHAKDVAAFYQLLELPVTRPSTRTSLSSSASSASPFPSRASGRPAPVAQPFTPSSRLTLTDTPIAAPAAARRVKGSPYPRYLLSPGDGLDDGQGDRCGGARLSLDRGKRRRASSDPADPDAFLSGIDELMTAATAPTPVAVTAAPAVTGVATAISATTLTAASAAPMPAPALPSFAGPRPRRFVPSTPAPSEPGTAAPVKSAVVRGPSGPAAVSAVAAARAALAAGPLARVHDASRGSHAFAGAIAKGASHKTVVLPGAGEAASGKVVTSSLLTSTFSAASSVVGASSTCAATQAAEARRQRLLASQLLGNKSLAAAHSQSMATLRSMR